MDFSDELEIQKEILNQEDEHYKSLALQTDQNEIAVVRAEFFASFDNSLSKAKLAYIIKCLCENIVKVDDEDEEGLSLIHLACKTLNPTLIQAILAFGPNISIFDNEDNVLEKLINEAWRLPWNKSNIDSIRYILFALGLGFKEAFVDNKEELELIKEDYRLIENLVIYHEPNIGQYEKDGTKILCLDGGGTRGFVILEILAYIEKRTGKLIKDNFDWITGTSAGGIIGLYLSLGHTVNEARALYFKFKDKVFDSKLPFYEEKNLEQELISAFGEETKMSDIKGIRVVITTSTGPIENLKLHLLNNFEPIKMNEKIWEVARKTSAAPIYFRPFQNSENEKFYDGGLTSNNPCLALLSLISELDTDFNFDKNLKLKNACIISIGTGLVKGGEIFEGEFKNFQLTNIIKYIDEGTKLLSMVINQACKSDGEVVNYAKQFCKQSFSFYYRLQPLLPKEVKLNEIDNEVLLNLIFHTKGFISKNETMLNKICQRLIGEFKKPPVSEQPVEKVTSNKNFEKKVQEKKKEEEIKGKNNKIKFFFILVILFILPIFISYNFNSSSNNEIKASAN